MTYLDGQGIDEHFGHVSNLEKVTYETDRLGSVLNAHVAGLLRAYGAFGESNPSILPELPTRNPSLYGFAGRQFDSESGLYYNRARMYDQVSGRFLSKDPIGLDMRGLSVYQESNNPFKYANNNPLKFIDPSGLYPDDPAYLPGAAGTQGVDRDSYNQGVAMGATIGAVIGTGILSAPTLLTGIVEAGSSAFNLCLLNPLSCAQVGVSAGAGFLTGIQNGLDPDSQATKLPPGFTNIGYLPNPVAGLGNLIGTATGAAINACYK